MPCFKGTWKCPTSGPFQMGGLILIWRYANLPNIWDMSHWIQQDSNPQPFDGEANAMLSELPSLCFTLNILFHNYFNMNIGLRSAQKFYHHKYLCKQVKRHNYSSKKTTNKLSNIIHKNTKKPLFERYSILKMFVSKVIVSLFCISFL